MPEPADTEQQLEEWLLAVPGRRIEIAASARRGWRATLHGLIVCVGAGATLHEAVHFALTKYRVHWLLTDA